MQKYPPVLVFSDLDGTLLDHTDYSWAPASAALARLRAEGCGLVLATSKTAAEVAPLREEIGFSEWPSIVENGGGLFLPGEAPEDNQDTYHQLRAVIRNLPQGFVGFGDMSMSEVCDRTGLSDQAARLAKRRRFSEPGIWTGPDGDIDAFTAAATDAGLYVQRGGRFLSLSFGGTKADLMEELIGRLRPGLTVALGDAPNDIQMLEGADIGVIIANNGAQAIPKLPGEASGRIRRSVREGPLGWSDAMVDILNEFTSAKDIPTHG